MSEAPALELKDVVRTFAQGGTRIEVLKGASLRILPGELVALTGPSGAGKSTLLQIAGLLEKPTSGDVFIDGENCGRMNDKRRTQIRREKLGFVYQFHHLLPEFSALENIVMPQILAGATKAAARERARGLLDQLGLNARESHRPARLSGGEQQRVAIARAIANSPLLLLADEPTGNLDQDTASSVFDALLSLVRGTGLAALIATHNPEIAARMDRGVTIKGGVLVPT